LIKIKNRLIVLLTDFGQKDTFVGVLKGVIAKINPESKVIDLSHSVEPQNIQHGAFLLSTSCSYFPRGTIFCVIVDPGVGSDRKVICIETQDYFFVGPDNGVLWEASSHNQIKRIFELTNQDYFLDFISTTFHGRDIFAPVAAHLSKGKIALSAFGRPLEKCVEFYFPEIERRPFSLGLTVLHIDRFGNVTLNLDENEFNLLVKDKKICLTINDFRIQNVCKSYSQAKDEELFLIWSSSSHMEISLKNSNAAEKLKVNLMDKALLEIIEQA